MAEEEDKRPALQEIPVRERKSTYDDERKIISLMNSLKDNFDAKLLALRKDLEQKTQEQVTNEILKVQDTIEKVQTDNNDARKELSKKITDLSEKMEKLATAPADDLNKLKQEAEASLRQVQDLMSKFDLTLFVDEIRGTYSLKIAQAEENVKILTAHTESLEQENKSLKQTLAEKDRKFQQEIEQIKQTQVNKEAELRQLSQGTAPTMNTLPNRATSLTRIPPNSSTNPVHSYLQKNPPPEEYPNQPESYPDQEKKSIQYCKNCGKTRSRATARFCIYCGSEF